MPRRWVEFFATGAFWVARRGSQESYGLPTPKFGLFGVCKLPPVLCLITLDCPMHVTCHLALKHHCLFGPGCASKSGARLEEPSPSLILNIFLLKATVLGCCPLHLKP